MSEHKNSSKLILDLGCGNKKREGTVGVDYNTRLDGDVNHDLNTFPYPFQAGSVDKIYIDNCIEHLDSPLHVMEEIHRILKKGGEVKVIVPYFRSPSAFHDPTHKTFYTTESFSYYDPDHPICKRYDYTKAYFKVEKIVFHEHLKSGFLKSIFVSIANKWPSLYENVFSSILPLHEISFYLRKV
ncbi:MAG: class I SAM-dependent methyltransferase [Flavobacteriaceae bacterium TMED238]|nr:MAG: class I SAM-dependent methyltransferase [Flavobacteriaceae bacterium TMED238]|tara:strand:+ start:4568 stop:5119 length:552 start_codon:yes stop_codon:yes gene_type:complete